MRPLICFSVAVVTLLSAFAPVPSRAAKTFAVMESLPSL